MADLPLRQFTQQLREQCPGAEQLRLRRGLDKDKRRVWQLTGTLPDGKRIARKLDATNEFSALEAAKVLLGELLSKGTHTGRIPPTGATARHEAIALRELEGRQLRPATLAHKVDHIRRLIDWLTERNLPLTQPTLLASVEAIELGTRAHRARLEAVSSLAKAAGLQVEIPPRLRYRDPLPKRRELITDLEIEQFLRKTVEALPERWRWLYRVVGCTGIRANGALSLVIPDGPIRPGTTLCYWDSKRSRPARTTPTLDLWDALELSDIPEGLKLLWMPLDRPADDLTLVRANSATQEATAACRRILGRETAARYSFRQLRHAAGARMLQAGLDPHHVSELMSTSIAQLEATYSGLFRSHAADAAGRAFGKIK